MTTPRPKQSRPLYISISGTEIQSLSDEQVLLYQSVKARVGVFYFGVKTVYIMPQPEVKDTSGKKLTSSEDSA